MCFGVNWVGEGPWVWNGLSVLGTAKPTLSTWDIRPRFD